MNVITDTLRQLVRRKLWPVALVLLGALVAVPLLLAKQPESDAIAQAANAKKVEPLPATFVSAAGGNETAEPTAKRRRVLGFRKDPFEPAELPKGKKKKTASKAQATPTATPAGDDSSSTSGGGSGDGAPTPPVSTAPTPTPAPTVTPDAPSGS